MDQREWDFSKSFSSAKQVINVKKQHRFDRLLLITHGLNQAGAWSRRTKNQQGRFSLSK